MFDVGFNELVLIFIIGLLVLGPQRLPKVAAEIGKWVGRERRTATELRRQLEREIELNDIQPPPSPPTPPTTTDTQNPFHQAPLDTSAPPADAASEAPAAAAEKPAAVAPTPEPATAAATANALEPVAAPAPEVAKVPEPTDRPPHA